VRHKQFHKLHLILIGNSDLLADYSHLVLPAPLLRPWTQTGPDL
jgi:hypothetical protein